MASTSIGVYVRLDRGEAIVNEVRNLTENLLNDKVSNSRLENILIKFRKALTNEWIDRISFQCPDNANRTYNAVSIYIDWKRHRVFLSTPEKSEIITEEGAILDEMLSDTFFELRRFFKNNTRVVVELTKEIRKNPAKAKFIRDELGLKSVKKLQYDLAEGTKKDGAHILLEELEVDLIIGARLL